MSTHLIRWWYALRTFRSYVKHLNRRVEVENVLFEAAAGKRPPLTGEQCRALALRLGDPNYVLPKGLV